MQVPTAAIIGSHAALSGLKTFSWRSKQFPTVFLRAAASGSSPTPSHSPGAAAGEKGREKGSSSTMVDGKLNYRVRKRRQPAVVNETEKPPAAESPAPNPLPSTEDDRPSVGRLVANAAPSVVAAAALTSIISKSSARRQSARVLKRVAEAEEQKLEVKNSSETTEFSESLSRTGRRVSSRKNAAAPSEAAEMNLPPPPPPAIATASDLWLSPLSEGSAGTSGGAAVVTDLVASSAMISPSMPKSLFAPEELAKALEHLKSVDPLLKDVIEMHGTPKFEKCKSAFSALCRNIVYQQLATKAASVIFGRLVTLCEGLDNLTPTTISQLSAVQMREIGISGRKASYLHDLAANFLSGALSDSSIHGMDDESLMKALIAVKGIGTWSVHMFMLISLHKPDVLPVTDLGIRKGLQKLYKLKELPTPDQAEKIALSWQPYRSLGSWYMWRVLG